MTLWLCSLLYAEWWIQVHSMWSFRTDKIFIFKLVSLILYNQYFRMPDVFSSLLVLLWIIIWSISTRKKCNCRLLLNFVAVFYFEWNFVFYRGKKSVSTLKLKSTLPYCEIVLQTFFKNMKRQFRNFAGFDSRAFRSQDIVKTDLKRFTEKKTNNLFQRLDLTWIMNFFCFIE